MTKRTDKRTKIGTFMTRVAAFSLLLTMLLGVTVFAGVNEADTNAEDYSFVVIQEDEVPLAAAPSDNNYSASVLWVVVASILLVGIFFHGVTILNYRNKVNEIANALSQDEYREMMKCSILFNPTRHKDALMEKEAEIAARRV